jgi:hypothetical protein
MMSRALAFALTLAAASVVSMGCHRHQMIWHGQPVSSPVVRIQPTSVIAESDRLWVQTIVYNVGTETVWVERDAITLTLADGQTLPVRGHHTGYTLAPHASHKVYVDFESEEFDWRKLPSAQVNWTGAVSIQGQIVGLPPMFVSPQMIVPQPTYVAPPPAATYYQPPAAPSDAPR